MAKPFYVLHKICSARKEIKNLQALIEHLQKRCKHVWKCDEPPDLKKTLVPTVFVGSISGVIGVNEPTTLHFRCVCQKCTKIIEGEASQTCPHCLVKLEEGGCLGAGSRVQYFGRDYLYYSVQVNRCPKCNFAIASDVWDQ